MTREERARLAAVFARSGYVRRFEAQRRLRVGSSAYKKGFEVRLSLRSKQELREVRRLLKAVGLNPGRPFQKHSRLVQPVYGKAALDWFLSQLPIGPERARTGFAASGARVARRSGRLAGSS